MTKDIEVSYHFTNDAEVSIDSDESQKISKFRRILPQLLAVAVKNLVMFSYGLTLGFPTIVIPALESNTTNSDGDFNLNDEEISWFSSINLLCVPLGCFFSGVLTEPAGKRTAMQIIKVPMFISWLIFYFSTSAYHLYLGLALMGISGGLMETSVLTYVAEVAEPRYRGMFTATGTTTVVTGILVQFVLGAFLKWRVIALVCSVMPLLTIFALCFVPESPYWLITKNRVADAHNSLAWLRGWVKPHEVGEEFDGIHQALVQKKYPHESSTNRFTQYTHRSFLTPFVLLTITLFIWSFCGKTTLQTYAVKIFEMLDTPMDKYQATVLLGLCELIGAIICISLVRFFGKRPLIFLSLIVCAICFSATAIYAHHYIPAADDVSISNNGSIVCNRVSDVISIFSHSPNECAPDLISWTPLILLLTCALFIHIGIGILPWAMIGELYPARVRSGGSGISSGSGYVFAFLANKFFLLMLKYMTLAGTFLFYAAVSVFGCILLYFILPETEGRSLIEIEAFFANKETKTNKQDKS